MEDYSEAREWTIKAPFLSKRVSFSCREDKLVDDQQITNIK
jgi:hypothetical protein